MARGVTGRAAPARLFGAYALLVLAWGAGNPAFAAPDEWAHYVRAVAIAGGEWVGRMMAPVDDPRLTPAQRAWLSQTHRTVTMPAGLYAPNMDCNSRRVLESAACLHRLSPVRTASVQVAAAGNYAPLAYVAPSRAVLGGDHPISALMRGRLAAAIQCLALLGVAVWLVWGASSLSLVGLLVALSPMVLFVAGSLNPSGVEIAAGVALGAGAVRLWRESKPAPAVWLAVGGCGAVLALSRASGPLSVAPPLLLAAAMVGVGGAVQRVRAAWPAAAVAGVLVVVGVVGSRLWERDHGTHIDVGPTDLAQAAGPSVRRLPYLLAEAVGNFGSLDSPLPWLAHLLWLAATLAVVGAAIRTGSQRERLTLLAAGAAALAGCVALCCLALATVGDVAQGRHVLPFLVAVPLFAGEVLFRHRDRFDHGVASMALLALTGVVAGVHALAWYCNARRQAVGLDGPIVFLGSAEWAPPLGWWPWMVVVVAADLLLLVAMTATLMGPVGRLPWRGAGPSVSQRESPWRKVGAGPDTRGSGQPFPD